MAYLGNVPARSFISFERQVFTIVNSQTAYTLSHSVTNENDIRLVVNNVVQEPGSGKAYTASGTTLTLSAALTNGTDEMYCVFLGRAVGTVNAPAGSVGNSQTAATMITGQTAETTVADDDLVLLSDTSASAALKKMTVANLTANAGVAGVTSSANANAINIESSERVQFTRARSNTLGDSALEIQPSDTVVGVGFRMENTNNDIVVEKSSPSGSEAEIFRIRSGGGIALGGTGDANTIDDYEEGTWTLTVTGQTTDSSQVSRYTKIGNRVFIDSFFVCDTDVSATSESQPMQGLPFSAGTSTRAIINLKFLKTSAEAGYGGAPTLGSSSAISLETYNSNFIIRPISTTETNTSLYYRQNIFRNGTIMRLSGSYETTA
jgi:hypothetical protein